MPKPFRLFIAYDGSPCADAMIDDLRYAGLPAATNALVVSVAERWLPPPSAYEVTTGPVHARGKEHATRLALLGASRVSSLYPHWTVHHEGYADSPARLIVQRARDWQANLVVAGSLGHTTIERLVLGSVSHKVANEAHCSVRVSRGNPPSGELRLLLAYDGRPGADAARNWPDGTAVSVVGALGYGGPPMGEWDPPLTHSQINRLLSPAMLVLRQAGLAVHSTAREADPKHLIVEEAARIGAHCIFAGSNDHSVLDRLLLGTVSSALLSRAPCAVEVVR